MSLEEEGVTLFGDGDELSSDRSNNPHMNDLIAGLGRRQVLVGGATLDALAFLGAMFPANAAPAEVQAPAAEDLYGLSFKRRNRLPFEAIAGGRVDITRVPAGYEVTPFIPQGAPIGGNYPGFLNDASNSVRDQAEQIGMHHDGMHFLPTDAQFGFGGGHISSHGLLVFNHEYIDVPLLHTNGPAVVDDKRTVADEVRKETNAHGVSVAEIRHNVRGEWNAVPSQRNRRITAATSMRTTGSTRGHELLRAHHSPDDTRTHGTHNSCSSGFVSWGIYLTYEENWADYLSTQDNGLLCELTRCGIRSTSRFDWETLSDDEFKRSDTTRKGKQVQDNYRNEPNNLGWIVGIDPFDSQSVPAKRTALDRFAHEGLIFAPIRPGRQVVRYFDGDSQNEYIYRYVNRDKFRPGHSNIRLLDEGTLYVARSDAGGSGQWLPLDIVNGNFRAACRKTGMDFTDQGEVLINTRLAADIFGATRTDRPEQGVVSPDSGDIYFTFTNDASRTVADAANPRVRSAYGHIIRWREHSRDYAGQCFTWGLSMLAGPGEGSRGPDGKPLNQDDILASPDGFQFDPEGRLWIQIDMSGSQLSSDPFDNNQILMADPHTGELKRFLTGPLGCEVAGITVTPGFRTLFISIQHPGEGSTADNLLSIWLDGSGRRSRPITVVITHEDG